MATGYQYHLSIPWHVARSYFRKLKERCQDECMDLSDIELYRMQGESRAYKKLANLPEQLEIVAGDGTEKETK